MKEKLVQQTYPLAERFYRFLSANRRVMALCTYAVIAAGAYAAAYLMRFGWPLPEPFGGVFWYTLPVLVGIRLALMPLFGLSAGRWRFVSTVEVLRLGNATLLGTVIFLAVSRLLPVTPVPVGVVLMEMVITGSATAAVWLSYRTLFERLYSRYVNHIDKYRRVLIIGAGTAGNLMAQEMRRLSTGHRVVGFVDDDPLKQGTTLQGIEVHGPISRLPRLARKLRAEELLLAIPSAEPKDLRSVIERCERTALPYRMLPGIREVLDGKAGLHHLRDVRIEDLLGRDPIKLELPELADDLAGETVLITGAAGSIGSELARQVALHKPGELVLMDQAETDLFYLRLELQEKYPDVALVAVVGDVVDRSTVSRLFARHRPSRVYHAAAYKHVPLMEDNSCEAVRNNVIGTWRVAEAAGEYGTGKFVLVSTDKAVCPSSIMGATKRLAELSVLELQGIHRKTAYSAVRFGNVLGSKGSVVPIFKRQLEAGQPLTVTHPEATRYFMTIPEAVQLILQASLLADLRGRVAMLDMGEPVRIMDLASNMIRLSGNGGGRGDGIVITGLRPGEKLHEQLMDDQEETVATSIPRVRLIHGRGGGGPANPAMAYHISAWQRELEADDPDQVMVRLRGFFPELAADTAGKPAPDSQADGPPSAEKKKEKGKDKVPVEPAPRGLRVVGKG